MKIYDCELRVESCMVRNVNNRLGREEKVKKKSEEKVERKEAVVDLW